MIRLGNAAKYLKSAVTLTLISIGLAACAARAPIPTLMPTLKPIAPTALAVLQRRPVNTIAPTLTSEPSITPTFTSTPSVTPTATMTPTATSVPVSIWLAPDVPPEFKASFSALVSTGRFSWGSEAIAQVKFASAGRDISADLLSATWMYAPVAAFPTLADDIAWADVQTYWKGTPAALSTISGDGQFPVFVTSPSVLAWLTTLLGAPAAAIPMQIVPANQVAAMLWKLRPAAWSIVPFQQLEPSEKVLMLDGQSALSPGLAAYPLTQALALSGSQRDLAASALAQIGMLPTTNRDVSKLSVLVMTGTTALTRATAYQMEQTGITLPARDILPFLADANIVHTSNEVSFATDCPAPDPTYTDNNILFCARESYFDLLKAIHLNVVELTGNHMNDWGTTAFSHTLDMYAASGIPTFGGGRDAEHAREATILTSNGNIIAFIGCNPVGPDIAWATDTEPGAAKCDDAYLSKEIPRLKRVANVVIMTIQYQEFYQYTTPDDQVAFFRKYADMGADIVFGSQAHQAQGFAFVNGTDSAPGTFIHYGTGNLFFDQMDDISTRQMFMDKLIIYNGKHISTVLFTGINEDYSRPRPMTPDERNTFLTTIFTASGW